MILNCCSRVVPYRLTVIIQYADMQHVLPFIDGHYVGRHIIEHETEILPLLHQVIILYTECSALSCAIGTVGW